MAVNGTLPPFFINGRRLYSAFIFWLDTAKPVSTCQKQDASDDAHTKIQGAEYVQPPAACHASPLPERETENAETEIQKQAQPISIPQDVKEKSDQQGDDQPKQNEWKLHLYLRFEMLRKEIGNGVVAGDAILVLQNIVTFIFKDQQFDLFAFGFQLLHKVF